MENKFFQWIHDVLRNLGKIKTKLPIMGDFFLKNELEIDPILKISDFDEIQIFLIRIFSNKTSYPTNVQVALALSGYNWLKKERHRAYTQLFQNNQTYWDTLTHLLIQKYNVRGTRKSKRISREKNIYLQVSSSLA
jgi:hypothetical protein